MSKNYYIKFTCPKCGSNKLAFQEYVKSVTPAEFMSCGKIYYDPATIDQEDFISEPRGFCCRDCGHMLEHCGSQVRTEKELWDYFEKLPCSPGKSNGASEYDEYELSQGSLDLLDKVERDGIVVRNIEGDK